MLRSRPRSGRLRPLRSTGARAPTRYPVDRVSAPHLSSVSSDSRTWLRRLRADVRARLFGGKGAASAGADEAERFAPPADPVRIGRFVVIKRIGQGGMGVIYAAYDDLLDRKVAVKLLRPDGHGTGTDGRARLMREAQALARLSHESVIQVYEVGEFEDKVYVAMEFVDGATLKTWQSSNARGWREVLDAYLAAGRGLAAAHAAGIVHRDFKPDNVLVGRDGSVRVIDFGLARKEVARSDPSGKYERPEIASLVRQATDGLGLETVKTGDGALTRTGAIMGTPAYMAPEQHMGQHTDARTDQFSYCVALYEALYGFRPFGGDSLFVLRENVLAGNLHAPPKFTESPPHVLRVLERGLQMHPNERYGDMQQLLSDLIHDPRRRVRRALALLAVALVFLVAGGFWWSARSERAARAEGQRLRAEFERARVVNAEAELRRAQSRTVSQKWDDLVLSYAREVIDEDPTRALAVLKHLSDENDEWLPAARSIASDALHRGVIARRVRPQIGQVSRLRWTADGTQLLMSGHGGQLVVWDETEGLREVLATGVPLEDFAVAGDDDRVAAVGRDGRLHLLRLRAGPDEVPRALAPQDGPLTAVAIHPDGDIVVTGARDGTVRLWSWEGQTKRALSNHDEAISRVVIAPHGEHMASASADGTIRLWFLDRKTHWVLEGHEGAVADVAFTAAGELLSLGAEGAVRTWSTSSGKSYRVGHDGIVDGIAFNDLGHSLASFRAGRQVMLTRDEDERTLLGLPGSVVTMALTPKGDRAALATADGTVQVFRFGDPRSGATRPDGTRITQLAAPIVALASSPKGELFATATSQGNVQLWSETGGAKAKLGTHTRQISRLKFSPQGFDLAGIDELGGLVVWSITDRDVRPRLLRGEGSKRSRAFTWTPDGTAVAAASCAGAQECTIVRYPVHGGEPTSLPATESPAVLLQFSPDGGALVSDHQDGPRLWDLQTEAETRPIWEEGEEPGKRLAYVFHGDGKSLRLASADELVDEQGRPVSRTLRVWHIDRDDPNPHLLFEEPELTRLLVDQSMTTLLLRTHDDRSLLWSLDDDRMRLLPTVRGVFDRLVVSPTRDALLLRPDAELGGEDATSRLVQIDTGEARSFPRVYDPMAWTPEGTIADVRHLSWLRTWRDPTPDDAGTFRQWLHETTDVAADASTIR